mgnify:CR=1 FL=1
MVGDTGETDTLLEHCQNADALVIESTYLEEEADLAKKFTHLTARQAAELAVNANVGQLYLTHLSRRYSEREIRAEARATFANTHVARDLDHYQITREGVIRIKKEEG